MRHPPGWPMSAWMMFAPQPPKPNRSAPRSSVMSPRCRVRANSRSSSIRRAPTSLGSASEGPVRKLMLACLAAALVLMVAAPARSADEPDLIFKRSTVFKWLTPNDKLATYGLDDPEVEGVACHFTVPER